MLRDLLCQLPQFATWPCDEINYIWRFGNRDHPTDQFTRSMVHERNLKHIHGRFAALQRLHPDSAIVEKTCANSLRCAFLHELFPDAKFVHIIRDGRDVAASAALRWNAVLDLPYLIRKARFVPKTDLPFYAYRYLSSRVHRVVSGEKRLATWGPKFEGMEQAFTEHSLPGGCAVQWRTCVSAAIDQLAEVPDELVMTIRYESFTKEPASEFAAVCQFLGSPVSSEQLSPLVKTVSNRSVGKWTQQLTSEQAAEVQTVAGALLDRLGYAEVPC